MTQTNEMPPATPASAVAAGLTGIAESTAKMANLLRANPGELRTVAESAKAFNKQYSDLVDGIQDYAEGYQRLQETTANVTQSAGWIGGNYSNGGGVAVNNSFGRVVGSHAEL